MEEAIQRVDQLVRKNNAKYKDQQSQKAYEQALKEYEKQAKAELARQYAQAVKEGNRKAVQKAKMAKKVQKKQKKKPLPPPSPQQQQQKKPSQPPKKKISQAQVNVINKTIQARAQRIMQQQQLQRLNRKLQQQKKRTKLYELNQKCKKMLSKSHQRIVSAKNIPEERMKILKKLEDKAVGEINQLDCIINNLIDKANENTKQTKHAEIDIMINKQQQSNRAIQMKQQVEQPENDDDNYEKEKEEYDIEGEFELDGENWEDEAFNNLENNFLNINTIIFQKSSQELLNMDYIPI